MSASTPVIAVMMSSVASRSTSAVSSCPWYRVRSTGGPAATVTLCRGKRFNLPLPPRPYGGMISWAPQCATGMTGAPVISATRAAPLLPVIGQTSGSRVRVPSG